MAAAITSATACPCLRANPAECRADRSASASRSTSEFVNARIGARAMMDSISRVLRDCLDNPEPNGALRAESAGLRKLECMSPTAATCPAKAARTIPITPMPASSRSRKPIAGWGCGAAACRCPVQSAWRRADHSSGDAAFRRSGAAALAAGPHQDRHQRLLPASPSDVAGRPGGGRKARLVVSVHHDSEEYRERLKPIFALLAQWRHDHGVRRRDPPVAKELDPSLRRLWRQHAAFRGRQPARQLGDLPGPPLQAAS